MLSGDIRPVFDCLCQILSLYGFSAITPDVFCLAKYDQNEAAVPLWRLIYELICFNTNSTVDDVTKAEFSQMSKVKLVKKIKRDLYQRGYTYDHFLSLDEKMTTGSQQLLVCLGWLIYHIKFIDRSMELCLNSLSTKKNSKKKCSLIEEIECASRANLKIRSGLRAIQNLNSKDNHRMSAFEAKLCEHPHLLPQYSIELDQEYRKLSLFLFWNKHENIFWKWMESVLDQPAIIEDGETLHDVDCQRLEAEKQKFYAAIDTLDSALVQLEQLWISSNNRQSIESDVLSMISSIDTEISSLFNGLLNYDSLITK